MTDKGGLIAINPSDVPTEVPVALRSKAFSAFCQDARCLVANPVRRMIASGQVVGRAFVAPSTATAVPTLAPWSLALLSLLLAPLAWLHKRRQR